MRQGQFKNRSRNRGRRPSSPLSRVFESNGPDVKVRGTAQHVAEKYLQLARDAMSSGDTVMGENYYQHAEHYLRIVAAAQTYQQQQHGYQPNQRRPDGEEEGFEDGDEPMADGRVQPSFTEQPEVETQVEQEPDPQPAASASPAPRQQSSEGRRNWDGHQPDFLKRSSGSNGSRPRRERSGRGRGSQAQNAEGEATEGASREETPEQVG